jgi:diguanylate cyclase (GGDEF)-like protein
MFESQRQRERDARLEGEVHRWADMFAAAIESTGVGVITTDLRGTIEYLNPTAQRLLGVALGDKRAALNLAAFHDPTELARAADDAARLHVPCTTPFDAVVARARARDGVDRHDWTWVSLAGVRAPMMVTLSALRDRAGAPTGWVIVGSDLTELRAAEAERVRAAALEAQLGALRRRELETAKVSEAYEYVSASRSLREALHVIGAFLPSIFGELPPQLLVQRAPSRGDDGGARDDDGGALRAIEQRDCWCLKTGQRFISEPQGLRCNHLGVDGRAWVCTPLADGAGTVAVLSAPLSTGPVTSSTAASMSTTAGNGGASEEAQRRAAGLSDLARQLSSVLANLRLRKTLEEQATHDPLTGAVNRRQLEAELKLTVHRHDKTGEPFAVLVVDVDHFKRINDAFGHERGDRVLAGLGTLLRKRLRASDVLARVGGEEFVVLLRAVDRATTEALAESFRGAVEAAQLAGNDVFCTCSIGAVHVARLNVGVDELLRRADRALYEAKATGRNRVVFGDSGAPRVLRESA